MDLDAYFARIGYQGDRSPTLDTIRDLSVQHTHAIAFENLNSLTGRPVLLDLPALTQKFVHHQRGGYCYEHNTFFKQVLHSLGLPATGLAARVIWNAPPGTIPPRSHMLLLVRVGSLPYLVDVGFGIQSPLILRLTPGLEQETSHDPCRLLQHGDDYVLQAKIRGEWKDLYQFDLREQFPADYEVCNWHVSTHPNSLFVRNLLVSLPAPGRRYVLFNREFMVHHVGGESEKRSLDNIAEIRSALTDVFRIRLPESPQLDEALERILALPPLF